MSTDARSARGSGENLAGALLALRLDAELLRIPRKTYCNYENGRNNVPNEVLCALADYYHTSTDYLLGRTDNPAPPPG